MKGIKQHLSDAFLQMNFYSYRLDSAIKESLLIVHEPLNVVHYEAIEVIEGAWTCFGRHYGVQALQRHVKDTHSNRSRTFRTGFQGIMPSLLALTMCLMRP